MDGGAEISNSVLHPGQNPSLILRRSVLEWWSEVEYLYLLNPETKFIIIFLIMSPGEH